MLTIVIHYSCDRLPQLLNTISCIDDMNGTRDAEKLLLVDGKTNIVPVGWKVHEIERDDPVFYNCSKIWNKGFQLAKNDVVLTMESDRILDKSWLTAAMPVFSSNEFKFVSNTKLCSLDDSYDLATIREIRDNPFKHADKLIKDYRVYDPNEGIGKKNPMSGCLLTTKQAYASIGGFDENYLQAGYHDLDAFRKAHTIDRNSILALPSIELHQKHEYAGGLERFKIVNLWNAVRYHDKWNIEMHPNIIQLSKSLNLDIGVVRSKKLGDLL